MLAAKSRGGARGLLVTAFVSLLAASALAGTAAAQPGYISTYAGNGTQGYTGDGDLATLASLNRPYGLAVDSAGNLYIADYGAHVVRKVDAATGVISTFAGNGIQGWTGDGGPATAASITGPIALAVTPSGDVYVTEFTGSRVRKVDGATGIISTVAGTGVPGYNGDGIPAAAAQLNYPWGIAADAAGNLYVADQLNFRIRKIDAVTGLISTYAGTGVRAYTGDGGAATAAAMTDVAGMSVDTDGNLYLAQYYDCAIRRVDAATGIIDRAVGNGIQGFSGDGGAARSASIFWPYDVRADAAGNLYVADTGNFRVRFVAADTGIISTVAGSGVWGFSGDGGPATLAAMRETVAVAVNATGDLFISDSYNYRVRMVEGKAVPVITWANPASIVYGTALSATQLNATADAAGTFVYDPPAGTILGAGAGQTLTVTFTPDDLAAYWPATAQVTIDVEKAMPALTWAAPAAVPSGTVLGAAQLNATADVPGSFVYDPPAGTVVLATTQLWTTFTPDDAANHSTASADVTLTVTSGPVNGPPYTLTVTLPEGGKVTGAGVNCGAGGTKCTVTMPAAMTLGLSAAASAGYTFTRWTGDCTGTSPGLWLSLQGPRACGAEFAPPTQAFKLTIAPRPTGGTVTGSGLECGSGGDLCSATFGYATTVPLTAHADFGYTFTRWGGACAGTDVATSVQVNAERTCTATFTPIGGTSDGPPYTLTISPVPAGGTVTGAGINCGAGATKCSVTMPAPMKIGLEAAAGAGFTFAGWTGHCAGTTAGLYLPLNGPRTCGASFTATGGGGVTPPEAGTITTFAGTGTPGYSGDGGQAADAQIYFPMEIAVDQAGNVYFAEYGSHRIRRVSKADGTISTFAGTGVAGFSGDGGQATAAQLTNPSGVAFDGAGNLLIADRWNHRLRKVDVSTGVITTVAGTGVAGTAGDGGPASAAELYHPYGVAVDGAGNVFITEQVSNRVRRIDAATGLVSTFAGNGDTGYSGDGGPATAATMQTPYAVEADAAGNVYIADLYNHVVRRVDAATGIISTFAGTGAAGAGADSVLATESAMNFPIGLALDAAGNLLVSEYNNARVRSVSAATGIVTTIAGVGTQGFSGDGGAATLAQFNIPYGLAVNGSGDLFVADLGNSRIRKVAAGTAAPVDGPPYTLTVTAPVGGKVTGAGINCGAGGTKCSVTMPAAMTIGLEAVASAGYSFGGWTGDCAGTSPGLWLALKGARTCGATFTPR